MATTETFFTIVCPEEDGDSLGWAKAVWDTYGFDYDITRSRGGTVLAWPDGITVDELKQALDDKEIEYTTFEADPIKLFQ